MNRPAAVVVWVLGALTVAFVDTDPIAQAIVVSGAWTLLVRRRVDDRRLRPLAIGLTVLFVVTAAVNGLLSHTGATVLAVLPSWLPLVGGPVTAEGFAGGGSIALGLVAAVSATAALSVVIEPTDLVDGLPGVLHHAGAALGAAINLVPATAASVVAVREAQRLRGWRARGLRTMADLAVPVVLGAIERSVQLAESMEARAFGDGRRTRLRGQQRAARLLPVGVVALAAAVVAVVARLEGAATWYPYPVPTVPSPAPLALAPAVLVALAGAALPREDAASWVHEDEVALRPVDPA